MRAKDMVRFSRYSVPEFFGFVAEKDGKQIGAGATVKRSDGRWFVCLEVEDELRHHRVALHRFAKRFISLSASQFGVLYAMQSAKEPAAAKWLTILGFIQTDEVISGERVWTWQASSGQSAAAHRLPQPQSGSQQTSLAV